MNNLELVITNKTKSGSVHLQLKCDKDDIGVLYLTNEQYTDFVNILRIGCFNKNIELSVSDPFGEEEEEPNSFLNDNF